MGMDVYGKHPTSEVGKYFRASVWSWRPIANYVRELAPILCARCRYWDTNDGDGLNSSGAAALGRRIQEEIDSGRAAKLCEARAAALAALPPEQCELCHGTGTRTDRIGVDKGMAAKRWCNGCDGKGHRPSFDTFYVLDVERLQAFASFLKDCGGFKIW